MGTGVAGGLSGIALAVPCIGAGSFSNKIPKKKKGSAFIQSSVNAFMNFE